MNVSVCLSVCVCPRSYLWNYTSDLQILCKFCPPFAHKPRLLDVAAQLKRSAHVALGLAIKCAQ